jgi:hypothetical protein
MTVSEFKAFSLASYFISKHEECASSLYSDARKRKAEELVSNVEEKKVFSHHNELLPRVLHIAMPTFTANTGKLVSNCEQDQGCGVGTQKL